MEDGRLIRLKQAIDYLISEDRISNTADLASALGKQRSYISEILSGKRNISESFVHSLTNEFPEISDRWLLSGDGSMNEVSRIYDRINLILSRHGFSKREFEKGSNWGNFIFPGVYRNAEGNPTDIKVAAGWIDCILNLLPQYSEEWIKYGTGEMLNSSSNPGNKGIIVGNFSTVNNSPIDNRQYYSDSPDVLRTQIDMLEKELKDKLAVFDERIKEKDAQIKEKDAQIKEKDAQIKEKDAQIKQLLDILQKK